MTTSPREPWRLRYWSILLGQGVSLIGSSLTQFVLLWWITDTTGSVSSLATAGLLALLPQALLGAIGGTVADRYSRRLIMILADAISALCMVVLIVLFQTGRIEIWHIYTMMFIRSTMQAFQHPAAVSSTPMLVPERFVPRAAGLNQTISGVMLIAAAPLGAFAISIMPIGFALLIDVVTAILGIVPLLYFRIPQGRSLLRRAFHHELAEGIHVVWRSPGLRILYGLMATITLVIMPSFTLVPLLVKEHFNGGPPQVAFMEALAGAGIAIGGLIVVAAAPRRRVLWILSGFTAACFCIALAGIAPSNALWIAGAGWGFGSVFYVMGRSPITALLQINVANTLQGRVFSLLTAVESMAAPIGLLLVSPLGEQVGIRSLFIVMGLLSGVITLCGFLSPSLRKLEQSVIVERAFAD